MEGLRVRTVRRAAVELGYSRHNLAVALVSRTLTSVTVDDKPAVLVDDKYRRALRSARKAAA